MTPLETRLALKAAGFSPIPCKGKEPLIKEWQTKFDVCLEEMARWPGTNTGSNCAYTPVYDIDILHQEAAEAAEAAVKEWFDGRGIMPVRTGLAPKRALIFRTSTPFPKMVQYYRAPNGWVHKIEILCGGQQAVFFGTHPDTKQPYTWHGGCPGVDVTHDDLVEVTGEEILDLLKYVSDMLVEKFGYECIEQPLGNGRDHDAADTGELRGRVDADAEFAAMAPTGEGANYTQCKVIPSRIWDGYNLNDIVEEMVSRTLTVAAQHGVPWTEHGERKDVRSRVRSTLKNLFLSKYDYSTQAIPSWLSADWHAVWMSAFARGCRPEICNNGEGFYVRAVAVRHKTEKPKPHENAVDPDPVTEKQGAAPKSPTLPFGWMLYDSNRLTPPSWLIKQIMPETGIMILPGQWGVFKTTALLDISFSLMTGEPFAGHYKVKKRGSVMMYALEGLGTIDLRLRGIAEFAGMGNDPLPFFKKGDCPALSQKTAAGEIIAHIQALQKYSVATFGLPVVVVWIDTYSSAAGHTLSGDDSDRSATQKVFQTLRKISSETGVLVAVVDHYGKLVEAGTTGSAGKEGNADTVLANLGDRETSGAIDNLRMVVRKQRDGLSGFEIPFTVETVELGMDEDGDPITANALEWGEPRTVKKKKKGPRGKRVGPNDRLLMEALKMTLKDTGFPFVVEGETVQACHEGDLRTVFHDLLPRGKGDTGKSYRERQSIYFKRGVKRAVEAGWVAVHQQGDQTLITPS